MSRVLEFVQSEPWFIQPDALETIHSIAARTTTLSPEAIERMRGERLTNARTVRMRGDIAIVPVHGPLFRYANLFTAFSGATSYEVLANDIGAALADPAVRRIILEVDSPGGTVNGLADLADLIFQAREEKPVDAFVSGAGASGGYYVAAAAERVYGSVSSIVGSVGTVLGVEDRKLADKEAGIRRMTFVSAQSPKKRMDPFDEDPKRRADAKAELQNLVNSLSDVFVSDLSRFRGVDISTVLEEFGQGGVFVGAAGVEAGMVDEITTLEDLLAELAPEEAGELGAFGIPAAGGSHTASSEETMTAEATPTPAQDAPVVTVESIAAEHPAIAEHFREEGRAEGRTEGATAERERIIAISKLPANGLEEMRAELMADPEADVGAAAQKILMAGSERARAGGREHLEALASDEEELGTPEASAAEPDLSTDAAQAQFILTAGKSPAQA